MSQSIKAVILAGIIIASLIGGGGIATIYHNINEAKEESIEAAKPTPTPQIIYVTPEPTPTPTPTPKPVSTPEPTLIPSPEKTPEPTSIIEHVPIYISPDCYIYHAQPGDTLGSIARMFKVPVYWLAEVNGIRNPDIIEVGQEIRVPKD